MIRNVAPGWMAAQVGILTMVGGGAQALAVEPAAPPLIVPFEGEGRSSQEPADPLEAIPEDGMAKQDEKEGASSVNGPVESVDPLLGSPDDFLTGSDGGPVPAVDEIPPYDFNNLPSEIPPVEDLVLRTDGSEDGPWGGSDLSIPFGESLLIPAVQSGFDGVTAGAYAPVVGNRKSSGLVGGLYTSVVYDTNVQRSSVIPAGASKDDWIVSLAPFVSYGRQVGVWSYEAGGRFSYNQYLKGDDLSGWGYSLTGKVAYDGGRWNAVLGAGTSLVSGGNRYLGGYSEQLSYDSSLNVSYELGSKTRLDGGLVFNSTEAKSGGGADTESLGTDLAALWKYSPLLEFGPGFRYRWESSGTAGDRVTLGPLLRTRYRLTSKVALDSDMGINFFDYRDSGAGGSDQAFYARLGAGYQLSNIWAFNLSVGNDSVADESGGFRETFQLRTAVSRPIRRATWTLGVGYEKTSASGAAAVDTASFSIDSSLGMKVFGDRADAAAFILWRDQTEDGGRNDWSGAQLGLSLGTTF